LDIISSALHFARESMQNNQIFSKLKNQPV